MIKTQCAICDKSNNFTVLYQANFLPKDLNKYIFSARRMPDRKHYQIVKCNLDGLVRSNPVMDPKELARLYKESEFTYDQEVEGLIKTYIEALKPVLSRIKKKDNILEIGCGSGFILQKLYDMGYKNVYGVEPSVQAVQKAPRNIKKNIRVSVLKEKLYKAGSFKFIFMFQTLDHIPDPNFLLSQCAKILEGGGYILAFNHNVSSLSSRILKEKSPIIDIEHTFLYDTRTIRKLFEKNGYNVLNVSTPANYVSLKHLIWLFPFPNQIKRILLVVRAGFMSKYLHLKLGNLCIIAQNNE